jgi:hypothetical protein
MKPSDYIKEFDLFCDTFPYILGENLVRHVFETGAYDKFVTNDNLPWSPRAA